MFILDTDHISLIDRGGAEGQRILQRLATVPAADVAVCIVNYEEQMRGWLAEIAATKSVDRQLPKYKQLDEILGYYCGETILPFDAQALVQFQNLWIQRVRIGTMDLKIAAIALSNNATLLTRNSKDFGKVPGLQIDDWSI